MLSQRLILPSWLLLYWCSILDAAPGDDCQVINSNNAANPPCMEGFSLVPHGGRCTPQCLAGFTPYELKLTCLDGELSPSSSIQCLEHCPAPENLTGALVPSCAEGVSIPEGGTCTPQCEPGMVPEIPRVSAAGLEGAAAGLTCRNGQLSPAAFRCRPFQCRQPQGLFDLDPVHPAATSFPELAGAVLLWNRTFPRGGDDDYPAESECRSASPVSPDGNGCPSCYSPLLTVQTAGSELPSDKGDEFRLLLGFEASGGRRLALTFQGELRVAWSNGHSTADYTEVKIPISASDFEPVSGAADLGQSGGAQSLAWPYANVHQLDSGPDPDGGGRGSGLEVVRSVAAFKPVLKRPKEVTAVTVTGTCGGGDGFYSLEGVTAAGARYFYSASTYWYLFYDPSCDGGTTSSRWTFDATAPSTTASSDLDGDGKCRYYGRINSNNLNVPLGTRTWNFPCFGSWTETVVTISEADVALSHYCSGNWLGDYLLHNLLHTTPGSVDACKAQCSNSKTCVAISYGRSDGGYPGKCVLCTSAQLSSHGNWDTYLQDSGKFLGMQLGLRYVIPGCAIEREGLGSVTLFVAMQSVMYNMTSCMTSGMANSCNVSCLPGYAGGPPVVSCQRDEGLFTMSGCKAMCRANSQGSEAKAGIVVDAATELPRCAEGSTVPHGANCTSRCSSGFLPDVSMLVCSHGYFEPPRFSCFAYCKPPSGGPLAGTPVCEELVTSPVLQHGQTCTARCLPGFRPRWLGNIVPTGLSHGGLVSPQTLQLHCEHGNLVPVDTFDCQPIWIQMLDMATAGPRSWAPFTLPSSQAGNAVSAKQNLVSSSEAAVFELGAASALALRRVLTLSIDAVDVLAAWVGTKLVLVTSARRSLHDSTCAPVFSMQAGTNLTSLTQVQHLPLADLPGRLSAIYLPSNAAGKRKQLLLLASGMPGHGAASMHSCNFSGHANRPSAETNASGPNTTSKPDLPAVFTWNHSYFQEIQRLEVGALALEPFTLDGRVYVFASSGSKAARIYEWTAGGFVGHDLPHVKGAVMAAWLGCRNDYSFFDNVRQLPCSELRVEDCRREDVDAACGVLCGCQHSSPQLAVMISQQPMSRISVFQVQPGPVLKELSSVPVAKPVYSLCAIYVLAIAELFVVAAAGPEPHLQEGGHSSPIFAWRDPGGLKHVQDLSLPGPATSCTSVRTANAQLLLMSTGASDSASSHIFLAEGSFQWEVSDWGPCNLACRRASLDVGVRQRTVSCRGRPSGLVQPLESMCAGSRPSDEEPCPDLELCPGEVFEWRLGTWGKCEGLCGTGTQTRSVKCYVSVVFQNGNLASPPQIAEDPSRCPVIRPATEQTCSLSACGAFRVRNRVALLSGWHVEELEFTRDADCRMKILGKPIASGECADCSCLNATGHSGRCSPQLAFDGRAADDRITGTKWIAQCVPGASTLSASMAVAACQPGEAWLGLQALEPGNVRCIRLLQSGDRNYLSEEIALDVLDTEKGAWEPIAEWTGLSAESGWQILTVPDPCSRFVDCSGHGDAVGLPGSCRCVCDEGYSGSTCSLCSTGYVDFPDCRALPSASMAWRFVAMSSSAAQAWHVADVAFYSKLDCSPSSEVPRTLIGDFVASNWPHFGSAAAQLLHGINASTQPSKRSILSPARAFDADGRTTAWIGTCEMKGFDSATPDCAIGINWFGVIFRQPAEVRCVRFLQGEQDFTVNAVALEIWWGTLPVPEITATSSDADGNNLSSGNRTGGSNKSENLGDNGSLSNATIGSARRLTVADIVHSGNWWRVRSWSGLIDPDAAAPKPNFLRLACDIGLPTGTHVIHDCGQNRLPWQECRAWCEPGYLGKDARFLCKEDYSFAGIPPICQAAECNQGIPAQPGRVVAEDCFGLHTFETCTAICALGYQGDPLTYRCRADGALHEESTGSVGLLPDCQSLGDSLSELTSTARYWTPLSGVLGLALASWLSV